MSEKLDSDIDLMKAVEHLDEELRPFIDGQLEHRGLSSDGEKQAAVVPLSVNPPGPDVVADLPDEHTESSP